MILAVDQGTTGTTCLVVDERLRVRGRGYRELRQSYPRPGWVEHDPDDIVASVHAAAADALAGAGVGPGDLAAIGIANQRETTVVWDAATGRPLYPAIVWQDRRTAERCRTLPAALLRERTGLVPDPYFSATKLEWLLDRVGGDVRFGTVETWLVWTLTGGAVHVTDPTNASRTLLAALDPVAWDAQLLDLFGVPEVVLPAIVPSSGTVGTAAIAGADVPIAGLAGDQQAALFGQRCTRPGEGKATYGTGTFVLVNAGEGRTEAPAGILRTAAAQPGVTALEGAIFVTGAAVQWLRDGLGIIAAAEETEALARSVESTGGVHFVPALAGLGSPHWDAEARGLISGLSAGSGRAEIARAALEAIAFQTVDVVAAMGRPVGVLRADGGASANGWLMQFQADVLGVPVEVAAEREMTAIGAAALAGLAVGVWSGPGELEAVERHAARYEPRMSRDEAETLLRGWRRAVARARSDEAVG